MADAWGHPAAIDTDQLYFNVDARFELAYDDARNAMVLSQAAELAISLFEHGWQTVIIFGNSLFDPDDTAPVLARLCPVAEVYHVTLVPALQAVLARCGAGLPGRGPSRLAEDAGIHARKRHPGSALLDNSALTPEQTLAELARLVSVGAGRLSGLSDKGRPTRRTACGRVQAAPLASDMERPAMSRRARAAVRALGDSASSNWAWRPVPAIAHQCPVALPNQITADGNLPSRLVRARWMSWPGPESKGWRTPGPGVCGCTGRLLLVAWSVVPGYAT
jgi:hypothetical protein